jgi:hypothetical protein
MTAIQPAGQLSTPMTGSSQAFGEIKGGTAFACGDDALKDFHG